MSSFNINFQANTVGDHYVGYRTYNDPPNTYTVITVPVATPGAQSVTIPVPGNLYCAYDDITYTGYIIAACQDQTDGNGDGIPDLAITWTVIMPEQADPCQDSTVTCVATPISAVALSNAPTTCAPAGTYNLVITETNPGDEITPAVVTCDVDGGGLIVNITIVDGGLYKAAPTAAVDPLDFTCDIVPAFTVTMEVYCPKVILSSYDCAGHLDLSASSDYNLAVGDSLRFCADPALIAVIGDDFEVVDEGNCHCNECKEVVVSVPGASTGTGKISYQVCWDGTNVYGPLVLISRTIDWDDTINLGCILPDTLVVDIGTLDGVPTPVESPCS